MTDPPVLLKIADSIAHLVLNNPPQNEMDSLFFYELTRLRRDVFPSLQATGMIIYGKKRHFSSGANINELKTLYEYHDRTQTTSFLNSNLKTFIAIDTLPFPVVAAINGCCLGAGLELALTCDHRICSPHAVFSLPEITFGLMPGCGGTVRLPRLIQRGEAIEMILSGTIVSSEEACNIGLIDEIVDKKEIIPAAIELIKKQNLR